MVSPYDAVRETWKSTIKATSNRVAQGAAQGWIEELHTRRSILSFHSAFFGAAQSSSPITEGFAGDHLPA